MRMMSRVIPLLIFILLSCTPSPEVQEEKIGKRLDAEVHAFAAA